MAMLTAESFGCSNALSDYGYLLFHAGYGGQGVSSIGAAGPFGDPYITTHNPSNNDDATDGFELPLGGPIASGFVGYRVNNVYGNQLALRDAAGNTQLGMSIASNGTVSVTSGGATLWSGGTVLTSGWRYIEFGFVIDASAGSFAIHVDGVLLTSQTGLNTKGSAASGTVLSVAWLGNQNVAHIYVNDATGAAPNNGFLGDTRVVNVTPSAPGDAAQFTPVGNAANWQNAAVTPPQPGTDHNDSGTVGALDLFHTSGVPTGMSQIYAVQLRSQVSKSDGGTRTMANVVKSGGVTANGATNAVAASAGYMRDIVALDPATGAAWLPAAVNAAQIGYTVIA